MRGSPLELEAMGSTCAMQHYLLCDMHLPRDKASDTQTSTAEQTMIKMTICGTVGLIGLWSWSLHDLVRSPTADVTDRGAQSLSLTAY